MIVVENTFYTESHTRSLKIIWQIFNMHRLDRVLLDSHMICWISIDMPCMIVVRGKTAFTLNPIQGH